MHGCNKIFGNNKSFLCASQDGFGSLFGAAAAARFLLLISCLLCSLISFHAVPRAATFKIFMVDG
jgi:hypothetical protein